MRFLATPFHGIADYAIGMMLIPAPWVLGFANDTTAGAVVSVLAGIGLIAMCAYTDYEGAIFARIVRMPVHLGADVLLGLILIATPWLFGFADLGTFAWISFVLFGAGLVLLAPISKKAPARPSQREINRALVQEARVHARTSQRPQPMRSRRAGS
jgi:hypothetical protein